MVLQVKNQPFLQRLKFALQGLRWAFQHEVSFRSQLLAAVVAILSLLWIQPPLFWVALIVLLIALVFAAELFNTALENTLDGLHPEVAPFVRVAKDCAAAAVLLLSISSVLIYLFMLTDIYSQ